MRGARSFLLTALVAAAVAGCGSSSASSPLATSLSYFPKDSPFVLSVATAPNSPGVKGLQAMLRKIPFATFGEAALISQLQQKGLNYDTDIRPLFGNRLLVGLAGSLSHASVRTRVLVAWVTKDAGALSSLVKKLHLRRAQTYRGATLYDASTATVAVDGATLLVADSPEEVMAALNTRASGDGLSLSAYSRELGSLPRGALIQAAGNLSGLLASPKAAAARSVPWVAALRSYGAAISASSTGLTFRYTLNTTGQSLTSSELPLFPGGSPPGLAGTMPIQFGLHEPAATLRFVLDTLRRATPAKYAANQAQMKSVERTTGVNFGRDVLGQIGVSAAVESNGHGVTIARIDVINRAAVARTLSKLGTSALSLLGTHPHSYVTLGPGQFNTVNTPGHRPVLFGLVGSEFVVGTGSPAQLHAFATAPAAAAPGAQGSAAFRVALPQLIQLALRRAPSKTIQQVLASLGDITGWISSSTGALTGSATLALR